MTSYHFFIEVLKKSSALLTTNVVLLVGVGMLDAAAILSIAPLVDLFFHPDLMSVSKITHYTEGTLRKLGLPMTLETVAGTFIVLNLLRTGVYIGARYCIFQTKYRFLKGLVQETLQEFYRARWDFFTNSKQGTLVNTFVYELHRVGDAFGAVALCAASIFQAFLFLTVPLAVSWQITAVSVAAGIGLAAPLFLLGRLGHRLGREATDTANWFSSVIQESLALAKVVMGFANERKQLDQVTQAFEAHGNSVSRSLTLQVGVPLLYFPLGLCVIVIALFAARYLETPVSEASVVLYALLRVLPLIGQIPAQKTSIDTFLASFEQISRLRQQARSFRRKNGNKPFRGLCRGISLEKVTFSYAGQQPILQDVSLCIPKGHMVAIVGESGSGKSTLVDIIMGFHEVNSGQVLIDDVPLDQLELGSYRRRIGYVPQESVAFNKSIRDNLIWVSENVTDEEIRQACELAYATEFIERLPLGWDTVVGDRGVRLSGGQLQRLALARALLLKPDILILDEATSALDSQSERFIQQSIERLSGQITVIIVAHRLSTICNADYLYVLKQGTVVEHGTYRELASRHGEFSRMMAVQALQGAS